MTTLPAHRSGSALVRVVLYLVVAAGLFIGGSIATGTLLEPSAVEAVALLPFIVSAPLLVLLTYVAARIDGVNLVHYGASRPDRGLMRELIGIGSLTTAFLLLWMVAAASLGGSLRFAGLAPGFAAGPDWLPGHATLATIAIALGFLVQSSAEEWVFRGYVQGAIHDRHGLSFAVLGSAMLFALAHGTSPNQKLTGLLNTAVIGAGFSLLRHSTGSLWAPCIAHATWNTMLGFGFAFPVSGVELFHLADVRMTGPEWVTGGGYGPEASAVMTAMLLMLVALAWLRVERES